MALFVFVGAGSIAAGMAAAQTGAPNALMIALGHGVGLAIFVCMVVGGPFTGGVMNPGRALGPALIAWQWNGQAVYWIGPLIGGGIAGLVWKMVLLPKAPTNI